MKEKEILTEEKKKVPFAVLRKGIVGAFLGVSIMAGSAGLLSGCSAGKNGSTWYSGVDNPITTSVAGNVGDFYLDEDDFDIYKYTADGWSLIGNIKGQPGASGQPGATGQPGAAGQNGDVVVFRKTATAIEWKYSKEDDTAYRNLVDLSSITGNSGENGDSVVFRVENGYIQWKYSKAEDTTYANLVSLQTLTGAKGNDGKKVEITADTGYIKWRYEGETDYTNLVDLTTLVGAEGKSAYEVAKAAGFEGDVSAWLESLKGAKGEDGDSIELRVTETAIEWKYSKQAVTEYQELILLSEIKGKDGENGDSIVFRVENGYIQWKYSKAEDTTYANLVSLQTLTGAKGDDGKKVEITADTEYIKWRYEGQESYTNLINISSLKGEEGKSAYDIAKEAGFEGSKEEWLESLKGVSITQVDIKYEIDNFGVEYTIYTIHFSDGTTDTVRVEMPKRVDYIYYMGKSSFTMCEAGDEPTLKLYVYYEDGTSDEVEITEDMFVEDNEYGYEKIDFQTVGNYSTKIMYQGKTTTQEFRIVDPNDDSIESMTVNYSNVVMLHNGTNLVTNDYAGLNLYYECVNGKTGSISLNDANVSVDISNFNTVGEAFTANATYKNYTTSFEVLPVSDLSQLNVTGAYYNGSSGTMYCEINSSPFTESDYIVFSIENDDYYGDYIMPATPDLLTDFDNTVESSRKTYDFDSSKVLGQNIGTSFDITVYDPSLAEIMGVYGTGSFKAGTASTNDIYLSAFASTVVAGQFSFPVSYNDITVLNGSIDFNSVGTYMLSITYQGVSGVIEVSIYDPEICNIESISFNGNIDDLEVPVNATKQQLDEYIASVFNNLSATLYYYEPVDDEYSTGITITSANIDYSSLDTSKVGEQTIYLVYKLDGQTVEYREEIIVNVVVDMSQATVVQDYIISENLSNWYSQITAYNNGYAIMNMMGDEIVTDYTIEGNLFKYYDTMMGGYGYFALSAQDPDNAPNVLDCIDFYTPTGTAEKPMSVQKTYTASLTIQGMPMPVEILVYGDEDYVGDGEYFAQVNVTGFGLFTTVKVDIDQENNILTSIGREFTINQDDTLTEIVE